MCFRQKSRRITFIAKPSRLPVALQGGITGTAYVFDSYQNLITAPLPVSFELSSKSSQTQTRTMETRNGAAWTQMDRHRTRQKISLLHALAMFRALALSARCPVIPVA